MDMYNGFSFSICVILTVLSSSGLCLDNVALRKPAAQSGGWRDYTTADKAVDGNTDRRMIEQRSCAHPLVDKENIAWWRVDLEKKYDVFEVVIYNRDSNQERLSDSWILVSNETNQNPTASQTDPNDPTICNQITDGRHNTVTVRCTYNGGQYLRGQYVTIRRKDNAPHSNKHLLNFCEVIVRSCEHGKWGVEDCSKNCPTCSDGGCAVSNGYCYNGCVDGYWNDTCDQKCHCSSDTQDCDRDGFCSNGCDENYTGYSCSILLPVMSGDLVATYDEESGNVTFVFTEVQDITEYLIENKSSETEDWTEFGRLSRSNESLSASGLGPRTKFRVFPLISNGTKKMAKGKNPSESDFITTQATLQEEPTPNTNVGLIAGIAAAVLVLILLIIIVVVLLVRYRKQGMPLKNNKKDALIQSAKPMTSDSAYENPLAIQKVKSDTLKSVKIADPEYDIPKALPTTNGIPKPASRSQTPELPSGEEEEQIYDNPMTIPPIKVSELSSYIEKRKGEMDAFKKEYQQLPAGDKAMWEVGNKPENRNKNRFVNIRAYDHSRVVLSKVDGDIHSDYINADFITGYKDKPKVYVAAQGPKKSTVVDTWRMIWELNANRIVMVTNLVENGKPKCEKYWPDTVEQYGQFKVEMTSNEVFADYTVMQFKLTCKDESRTIHHLHFTSWPDHGVPITATALLNFRRKVRSYDDIAIGPLIVHCSAGVGRTGSFIALDTLLEQAKNEDEVDVYGYACVMRSNRVNMIQTMEQYIFVYDGLLEALMSGDTSIPCSELAETYEEMKKINPETNQSKLQDQFDVLEVLKPAKRDEKYTAMEPQNKDKNRDFEVLPSNRFRPFLSIKVEDCTDYINGVYIDGYKMRLAYILTQSPLPNTIIDLWRLVYDHASRTIVMLNQLSDDCPVYWPKDKETPLVFGPLTVSFLGETVDSATPSITVRDFSIVHSSKPNSPAVIKQFQLTNWLDGETFPESTKDLLELMDLLERWQQKSGNGPAIIHCRNGCDKSSLYCAASYTVEKLKLDQEVDVFHAVKHVRVCRPTAVPSMEQYMYLHEMGIEYMEKFDIYANFK